MKRFSEIIYIFDCFQITQNEEEKKCLQRDLQEGQSEILQLKELVNTKEGHLQYLETEIICLNRYVPQ